MDDLIFLQTFSINQLEYALQYDAVTITRRTLGELMSIIRISAN